MKLVVRFNPPEINVDFKQTVLDPVPSTQIIRDYTDLPDRYDGPTEVTSNNQTQILETNGLVMRNNITVNPIPSYYGRIVYDGSVITVC